MSTQPMDERLERALEAWVAVYGTGGYQTSNQAAAARLELDAAYRARPQPAAGLPVLLVNDQPMERWKGPQPAAPAVGALPATDTAALLAWLDLYRRYVRAGTADHSHLRSDLEQVLWAGRFRAAPQAVDLSARLVKALEAVYQRNASYAPMRELRGHIEAIGQAMIPQYNEVERETIELFEAWTECRAAWLAAHEQKNTAAAAGIDRQELVGDAVAQAPQGTANPLAQARSTPVATREFESPPDSAGNGQGQSVEHGPAATYTAERACAPSGQVGAKASVAEPGEQRTPVQAPPTVSTASTSERQPLVEESDDRRVSQTVSNADRSRKAGDGEHQGRGVGSLGELRGGRGDASDRRHGAEGASAHDRSGPHEAGGVGHVGSQGDHGLTSAASKGGERVSPSASDEPERLLSQADYNPPDDESHPLQLTQAEFNALLEYSTSLPTGKAIGKRWKRKQRNGWWIGEYVKDPDESMVGIVWTRYVEPPASPTPQWSAIERLIEDLNGFGERIVMRAQTFHISTDVRGFVFRKNEECSVEEALGEIVRTFARAKAGGADCGEGS